MIKRDCNAVDKDSPCRAGRDVTIKPTINFAYNEEIEKLECDKIETDINGKPIAMGCRVQFRDDEVIKRILSENGAEESNLRDTDLDSFNSYDEVFDKDGTVLIRRPNIVNIYDSSVTLYK